MTPRHLSIGLLLAAWLALLIVGAFAVAAIVNP